MRLLTPPEPLQPLQLYFHPVGRKAQMKCYFFYFFRLPFWVLCDKADAVCLGLAKLSLWLKPLCVLKRQLCGCPSTPNPLFPCLIIGQYTRSVGVRDQGGRTEMPVLWCGLMGLGRTGERREGTGREVRADWCLSKLVSSSYRVWRSQVH